MKQPKVVVLVPRRAGIPERDRLWQFCRDWWESDFPDWPIHEGHHNLGPFNRSAAINTAAAEQRDWDVAIILDTDIIVDPVAVRAAVSLALNTGAMVIGGHQQIHLTKEGSARIMAGYRGSWEINGFRETLYADTCSSCVVVSRKLWDQVGGFDPLFRGWGWEDYAFRYACETVSSTPMLRVSGTMYHLWHPSSTDGALGKQANKARAERYRLALGDKVAMAALIHEAHTPPPPLVLGKTRIPRILHRTVPAEINPQVEQWWDAFGELHPGWELKTHRDPMESEDWPELGDLWTSCANGAQRAGLIRLEALWRWGGVYVDSDVEPLRSLEPLLHLPGFAAWEDRNVVPDAVLGAEQGHPAVKEMMRLARSSVEAGQSAWDSGPGVTTAVLPGRNDWLTLPPGAFYPYHYKSKQLRNNDHLNEQPWCYAVHHWAGSWLERI